MVERNESLPDDPPVDKRRIVIRWFMVLGPLLAAFAQQQFAFGFVSWACTRGQMLLVHVPAILALVITGVAATLAWQQSGGGFDERPGDDGSDVGYARFFSVTGLALSALAFVLIIGQWLPTLFIHPCQR